MPRQTKEPGIFYMRLLMGLLYRFWYGFLSILYTLVKIRDSKIYLTLPS